MSFCFYTHGGSLHHMRKTHQEEFLIWVYNYHPIHRQKRSQNWREFAFVVYDTTFSSNDQSLATCSQHSPHERCDSQFEIDFYQYGWYAHFLLDPFFVQDEGNDLDVETPQIPPGVDLNPPYLDVKLTTTPEFSHKWC